MCYQPMVKDYVLKTGYHYTPLVFYNKYIHSSGLVPNSLSKADRELFSRTLGTLIPNNVVWLFSHRFEEIKLLGLLIERAYTHGFTQFVCLEVRYKNSDAISHNKGIRITHTGRVGDVIFHSEEPIEILTATIPPKQIKVIGYYDIQEAAKCRLKQLPNSDLITERNLNQGN